MNFGSYFSFYKVWGRQRAFVSCLLIFVKRFSRREKRSTFNIFIQYEATHYIYLDVFLKNVLLHFPHCLRD